MLGHVFIFSSDIFSHHLSKDCQIDNAFDIMKFKFNDNQKLEYEYINW